jgi:hypothetical protein
VISFHLIVTIQHNLVELNQWNISSVVSHQKKEHKSSGLENLLKLVVGTEVSSQEGFNLLLFY